MIINSNPFVYNEGFPTYTEIEAVNDRVTELENDESLLNISKTDAVENLSASLNKLIEDRAKKISSVNITADNNVNAVHFSGAILAVEHNLTSQVGIFQNMLLDNRIADGQSFDTLRAENIKATTGTLTDVNFVNVDFVSPQDTTFDNLIVDNLTVVNKLTATILNQSNFDNVMITDSTVYNSFLRNAEMQGDHADIEYAYIDRMTTDGIDLNVFQVTPQTEPVNSNTALGYDLNGNVIAVNPLYMVDLVLNAEYVAVDTNGDAVAGTKSRVVEQSENLITANAVNNAFGDFYSYLSNEDANVHQLFNDTANNFHNGFNDFNNDFNNFNAGLNDTFNNFVIDYNPVTNSLNELNNGLNELNNVYNSISNLVGPEVFNTLNGYNNTLNNHNNNLNGLGDVANALYEASAPKAIYHNSSFPVNYWGATGIKFVQGEVDLFVNAGKNTATNSLSGMRLDLEFDGYNMVFTAPVFENAINPPANYYDQYGRFIFNSNMDLFFNNCMYLNQPIGIPNHVTSMNNTFTYCYNFNQPINIPNGVVNMCYTFESCINFNQPVVIPNSVTNMRAAFDHCSNLNQLIVFSNNVTDISFVFSTCDSFNQPVVIPNSVTNMSLAFMRSLSFNQPITIPDSVVNAYYAFGFRIGHFDVNDAFNSPITIGPNSNLTDMSFMFLTRENFNQPLYIPKNVTNIAEMLEDCRNYVQNEIWIASTKLTNMYGAFAHILNSRPTINYVHINASIPRSSSNYIYNSLINGYAGITFTSDRILSDL